MLSIVLPADPAAPRLARLAVAQQLSLDPRCSDVQLCVSEVVTNAVRHARTPARLTIVAHGDWLTVEVADGSPELPVPRPATPLGPSGRGLRILDQIARRWGVSPTPEGKVVWFELDGGPT